MKTMAFAALLALAACGSENPVNPPPPLFGGFTPQESAAVIFAPAVCQTMTTITWSVSGIGLAFASYAGLCDAVTQTQFSCGTKVGSTTVLAVAGMGALGSGGVTLAGPGTYPYLARWPTELPFLASNGEATQVGAACEPLADSRVGGGSITIATVDATHVTGSVNLSFGNGSVFQQSFDAAVCPVTLDICALFFPCFPQVCLP
jgi:hypothetical protein